MKKKKVSKLLSSKETIFIITLSFLFLFSRLFNLQHRVGFGSDQEDLAFRVLELLSGNPVLLGSLTSFSGFAVGPYFTYLWAFFALFTNNDPVSGYFAGITVGLITVIVLFFTGRELFGKWGGYIASLVYLFSFTIYSWDIGAWTPSLFYLAHSLVIFGALLARNNKIGYLLVSFGIFWGISSHMTFFLTLIPVLIYWIFYRPLRPDLKSILSSFVVILLGALPLLVFDVTHGFSNIRRLIENTTDMYPEHVASASKILITFVKACATVFIPSASLYSSVVLVAVTLFLGTIYMLKKYDEKIFFLVLSAIITPLVFLFWNGNFSEYYIMATVIPFLLIGTHILTNITNKYMTLTIILFSLFFQINVERWRNVSVPLNLWAMKKVVSEAIRLGGDREYGVSLTTELGYNFGYKYIFNYYGAKPDLPPKKDQKRIITIVVPPGFDGVMAKKEYDGIGILWEGIDEPGN